MSANSSLEAALGAAIEDLNRESIPYMLLGGLALALSLPDTLPFKDELVAVAFAVVAFSIFEWAPRIDSKFTVIPEFGPCTRRLSPAQLTL